MPQYRFTEYFEHEVLRKRPYLKKEWCIQILEMLLRSESEGSSHELNYYADTDSLYIDLPGSRVLEDRYGANLAAMVVVKARPDGSPTSVSSSKRPRRRGWYSEQSRVLAGAGAHVAPAANPNAQKQSVSAEKTRMGFRFNHPSWSGCPISCLGMRRGDILLFRSNFASDRRGLRAAEHGVRLG